MNCDSCNKSVLPEEQDCIGGWKSLIPSLKLATLARARKIVISKNLICEAEMGGNESSSRATEEWDDSYIGEVTATKREDNEEWEDEDLGKHVCAHCRNNKAARMYLGTNYCEGCYEELQSVRQRKSYQFEEQLAKVRTEAKVEGGEATGGEEPQERETKEKERAPLLGGEV